MATITLRLDEWTRDEVERLAQARGTTISELLRSKIDDLLGKNVEMARKDAPRSMSLVERRTLALVHEVLAQLKSDEDDADYHRRRVRVLEEGFTAEYGDEFIALEPELAPSECSLVWDVLNMFTALKGSVARLSPDDLAELGDDDIYELSFNGFDGGDPRESRLLSYTKYLIDDGRWTDLAEHVGGRQEGNSHMPMLAAYQRMLRTFKTIVEERKQGRGTGRDIYNFGIAELRQMLDAQS